jgi:single-stranded DNA-binding protein
MAYLLGKNEITIMGYISNDPKFTETKTGNTAMYFNVFTPDHVKTAKATDGKTKGEYLPVAMYGERAEKMRFLRKGFFVYIVAKADYKKYLDERTNTWKTDCIFPVKELQVIKGDNKGGAKNAEVQTPPDEINFDGLPESDGSGLIGLDDLPFF